MRVAYVQDLNEARTQGGPHLDSKGVEVKLKS